MSKIEASAVSPESFQRQLREQIKSLEEQRPDLVVTEVRPRIYQVCIQTAEVTAELEINTNMGRFETGSIEADGKKVVCRQGWLVDGTPLCDVSAMLKLRGTDQPKNAFEEIYLHFFPKPKLKAPPAAEQLDGEQQEDAA